MTSIDYQQRRLVMLVVCASLTSCEAWQQNAAFWNSPQGQAMTVQAIQQQQILNQQSYQFEQERLLRQQQMHMDMARSMQPVRVEHSGSIDVQHSGTIRVSR
jgi:hypothetical protein